LRALTRILRIINRFNLGGPTYNATYLSRYLPDTYTTTFIGGSPMEQELHSGFIPESVGQPYIELPNMSRRISLWNDARSFMSLLGYMRKLRPHLVHTHAAKAGVIGRLAAICCRVPIRVHTYHGHVFSGYFSPTVSNLVQRAERFLAKHTHAIVAISESQKKDLVELYRIAPSEKVHVIPLGLDLKKFTENKEERRIAFRHAHGLSDSTFVYGIVGRLTAIKNHRLLFEAFALLPDLAPTVLVVVGDGELRSVLEEQAHSITSASKYKKILFTSWIKEIHLALPGFDAVVLSSNNEGTPVSLIEAQAAGVPVISTLVGGVMQCVAHNETGLLVEAQQPLALSEAMKEIKDNAALRSTMASKGPEFALRRFGYERLIKEMDELYCELLKTSKPLA
jgi:glycosyltransferase involved in cell wall biosynthesis